MGEYDNDRRTATGGVRGVFVTKSEGDNRCVTGVLPTLLGLIEDTIVDDGGVRGCKEPFLTRGFSTRGIKLLVLMLYNAEAPRICEGMKRLEKPGLDNTIVSSPKSPLQGLFYNSTRLGIPAAPLLEATP